MKVLYLSVWYPSEKDKMAGLFVEKHAQAVAAQGVEVRVNTWWPAADVVQLNVLTIKMGLIAYVLRRIWGIPYIIVEHWSGYLPQNGQYERLPRWKRAILEEIARTASAIYPVSQMLEDNMKRCGIRCDHWGRMHNVVDDFFYTDPSDVSTLPHPTRLLYVGCFDEAPKNVRSLLRAIKAVAECRQDFHLTLVGTGKDWHQCRDYAAELGITDSLLTWTGELPPHEVSRRMHRSDCFVFSSRWENAPVVLSECIAAGLPIVSTRAGGIPEMITPDMGILVPTEDDRALADAILHMLDHHQEYDRDAIRRHGHKYSFSSIGSQLANIYRRLSS